MADFGLSVAYGDTINGTDQGDYIESHGQRSQIFGGGGDDAILSGGYLSTVHGGDGNDQIEIIGSYVQIYGDEGDDILAVDCGYAKKNIANVSLTGGEGSDRFWLRPYFATEAGTFKSIFASTITDFNAADGDTIVLSNIQAVQALNPDAIECSYDDDGNLVDVAIYNENVFCLDYYRELDRSWSFRDSSGLIRFNLKDVYDLDRIADGAVSYNYYDFEWSRSFRDALHPSDKIALGLTKLHEAVYISSEYVGDFRLDAANRFLRFLDDSATSFSIADAFDDTVGGRMLAGDANDNKIFAGDYGNKLWGGSSGEDYLIGGNGDDTFFAGKTGDDAHYSYIVGCSDNDVVVLWNVNPGEFSVGEWTKDELDTESYLEVTMNDGSKLRMYCPDGVSTTTVQLGDGSRWQYNHVDKYWQALEPDTSDRLPTPLATEENLPDGLVKFNGAICVTSDYVGDVRVEDYIVDGQAAFFDYTANDLVYFYNANFEELRSLATYIDDANGLRCAKIRSNDGTYIELWSSLGEASTTIRLADDSLIRYNFDDNVWQRYTSVDDWQSIAAVNGLPIGLEKFGDTICVYSDYAGEIRLDEFEDDAATNVNAYNDKIPFRVLYGDENDNRITAGDYGADLYGGSSGNDTLIGGAGSDRFVAGILDGRTAIENCSDDDAVYLYDADYSNLMNGDIVMNGDASGVSIGSSEDPSIITILRPDGASIANVQLADGITWRYLYDGSGQVFEGNDGDNVLFASDYGDLLWGGTGGNDTLIGGAGDDVFQAGKGEGNTEIWFCEENDLVALWNISLEDISDVAFASADGFKAMKVTATDGTTIEIVSAEEVGSTDVQLGDGSQWRHNYSDGSWQAK